MRNKELAIPQAEVQASGIIDRPVAFIDEVNAVCAPAFLKRKGARVKPKSNRAEQTSTFEFGLQMEAVKLRRQADGMPDGIRRDELLQKALQADTAAHMNRWLASPFAQA